MSQNPAEQPAPPAVDISSEAADLAIQKAAMLMGSTDEWTDQESMIADFQQRLDALIANRADAHTQKEGWYARATRRQRELNEANATIARLSAQVEAARGVLVEIKRVADEEEIPDRHGKMRGACTQTCLAEVATLASAVLAKLTEGT